MTEVNKNVEEIVEPAVTEDNELLTKLEAEYNRLSLVRMILEERVKIGQLQAMLQPEPQEKPKEEPKVKRLKSDY